MITKKRKNIRVYKTILPNKKIVFETRITNSVWEPIQANTLENIAKQTKLKITGLITIGFKISIDFIPLHQIECSDNFGNRRCIPLSEEEQNEFWKIFSS